MSQYAEASQRQAELVGGATTDLTKNHSDRGRGSQGGTVPQGDNAPKINGYYAGIIHPDCSYDRCPTPNG